MIHSKNLNSKRYTKNIVLLHILIFFPALVLNLLKDILERSKKPFNKFRASAARTNAVFTADSNRNIRTSRKNWYKRNQPKAVQYRSGFTLIEVMISIMITGLLLAPLSLMYTMIVQRVHTSSKLYNLIVLSKNFLYEARQKQDTQSQDFSLEKQDFDFDVTLTYSLDKSVDPKSTLASLPGLHREMVTITWIQDGEKKREHLVAFVYKKPEQKKS